MKNHALKTDPGVFELSLYGKKLYEIRFDDRGFQQGDTVTLWETSYTGSDIKKGKPLEYTGRRINVRITHVLRGIYGLKKGWCIFGCEPNKEYEEKL